jgi:hypothetical protein
MKSDQIMLHALPIDAGAREVACRSVPFLAAPRRQDRGRSRRITDLQAQSETIPVGCEADVLLLLGMTNGDCDFGVAHWWEHPELKLHRDDQIHVGVKLGEVRLEYVSGASDAVPLIFGATVWTYNQWRHGPTHGWKRPVQEPFASRPDLRVRLDRALKLCEDDSRRHGSGDWSDPYRDAHYYLALRPRSEPICRIRILRNQGLRAWPVVSAVTLVNARNATDSLTALSSTGVLEADLTPRVDAQHPGDWSKELADLADALYTGPGDLPQEPARIAMPPELAGRAAHLAFHGGRLGGMLSNIWTANLAQIDRKFDSQTGRFAETEPESPWYGGYQGFGTWAPAGIYSPYTYSRTADHYVTLALRCIDDVRRASTFVDFADRYLYFTRPDHDPLNGPPNAGYPAEEHPPGMPPHWAFVHNADWEHDSATKPPHSLGGIPGDCETDGHSAMLVARWTAWRHLGKPVDGWLTRGRPEVFGKSRWRSTYDAAEFLCWLMDYTGRDVLWCLGENTGWGAPVDWCDPSKGYSLTPGEFPASRDPAAVQRWFANCDMFEVYPTWLGILALRCAGDMAEAVGEISPAQRWRTYADRLYAGALRLLTSGDRFQRTWKIPSHSVWPSLQDRLAPAFLALYRDGLDSQRWPAEIAAISRRTLAEQLALPCGHKPVLAMGYGSGWLSKAALVLDELDDAGRVLEGVAECSYDKNCDYEDTAKGVDWRRWLWLIPEGANLLPDGRWHRIGDLSNGANQGPCMHALELCAGIDDTDTNDLRLLPRIPPPLTAMTVSRFPVLAGDSKELRRIFVSYEFNLGNRCFTLQASEPLPNLAVRLGPFPNRQATEQAGAGLSPDGAVQWHVVCSGHANGFKAWWLWVAGLRHVTTLSWKW